MKRFLFILLIMFALFGLVCSVLTVRYLWEKLTTCNHPSFTQTVIQPSCAEGGKTINRCVRCSYEYYSDFTEPSNHTLSSITVPPSCSSQGYALQYCLCGYSHKSDYVPPLSHSLECELISPTCTDAGYSLYKCQSCDYEFKSDFVAPVGHSFKATTSLPTHKSAGYTEYVCDCSYKYVGNYVFYSDILDSAYTDNTNVLARGIDVSRWNHQIDTISGDYLPLDWELIKASGFEFVILKAGSTKSGIEPTFEADYAGAKAAGLQVGAYFYTYSTTVSGITRDAQMLMSWLSGKQFEFPIYLDLEDSSLSGLGRQQLGNMCSAFLDELQRGGFYVGLYTNHTWLTSILDTEKAVTLFDIWYARYPGTDVPVWNTDKYGEQLGMWQFTQNGSIEGIDGSFDFNYAYKNYFEIMKKWGFNGYTKT